MRLLEHVTFACIAPEPVGNGLVAGHLLVSEHRGGGNNCVCVCVRVGGSVGN